MRDLKDNKISFKKRLLFSIVAGLLALIAISANGTASEQTTILGKLRDELSGNGLVFLIAGAAVIFVYYKAYAFYRKNRMATCHVLAAFFAISMLIGLSYNKNGNWDFIFGDIKQFIIAAIVFAGYYFLADVALTLLLTKMEKLEIKELTFKNPALQWIDKHFFLFAFLVIVLLWAPFLITHLPGSVPYDGARQLRMYVGAETFSKHHPWLLTYIYGGIFTLGSQVSDNLGVFLNVILFFVIDALCYAEVSRKLKQLSNNLILGFCSTAFFAILPAFGAFAEALIKDGIFTALFALFIVWCLDLYFLKPEETSKGKPAFKIIRLFIIGVLVCLTRNNGIYMVIPEMFVLIFLFRKNMKRYAVILLLGIFICYSGLESFATNVLGVEDGSIKEMLSIPFQQTARYLLEYPDDVTEEEAQAIEDVLDYNALAERYEPEISDHVKDSFDKRGSKKEYLKAWFSMFKKHPGVYFEATLNNTYGYYYLFYSKEILSTYPMYINDDTLTDAELDIYYIVSDDTKALTNNYAQIWRKIPILCQLMNPAFYTWLVLVLGGYLIRRRRIKQLLFMAGPALNILICIASPVNGLFRYVMPLAACAPILIFWVLYTNKKNNEGNNEENNEGCNE